LCAYSRPIKDQANEFWECSPDTGEKVKPPSLIDWKFVRRRDWQQFIISSRTGSGLYKASLIKPYGAIVIETIAGNNRGLQDVQAVREKWPTRVFD
jgi:hypothetical protein